MDTFKDKVLGVLIDIVGENEECIGVYYSKVNIYVSEEMYNVASSLILFNFMKFVIDPDRKGVDYGYSLKKDCVSDVKIFFEHDNI